MIRDFHAKLTVYGLSKLSQQERDKIARWLDNQATVVRKAKPKVYANRYTARFMKPKVPA